MSCWGRSADYPLWAVPAQILLSGGEPLHLEKLRDGIHQSITGSARRPLAPRDPNVPRVWKSACMLIVHAELPVLLHHRDVYGPG